MLMRITSFLLFAICSLLLANTTVAQKKNEAYHYRIKQKTKAIKIDGLENDAAWQDTQLADNFWMMTPWDTSRARAKTEVRMAFDTQFLYILAINNKPIKGQTAVESLRRDFNFGRNDNFIFFMDTFEDLTNGFTFGANAVGAQWDGTQFDGGRADLSWDNKWTSVVKNYDDRWVFEAAIPFKSIRYNPAQTRWGINFGRLDIGINEKSTWAPIPRQFQSANLGYAGVLDWDTPPPSVGKNISVIPYVLAKTSRDFTKPQSTALTNADIGGDVKIGITSSMNLDITVNPDFSQVEVDRQQTNLDRFELFFPERRQFFLENADLFANFGFQGLRPFFSRRIGLGVPIAFGARLSGKLDRNWRLGLLDMQTREQGATPAQNFAVMSLQRKVLKRSNVGLMMVNKQSLGLDALRHKGVSEYNRNVGAEFNLASANNFWTGKAMVFKSFSPNVSGQDWAQAASLNYNTTNINASMQYENMGENYNAEVGYTPNAARKGYIKFAPMAGYLFYPKSKTIISHGPMVASALFYTKTLDLLDSDTFGGYSVNFMNRTTAMFWVGGDKVNLKQPFDPTNRGGDKLPANTQHTWLAWGTELESNPAKVLTASFSSRYGGYYADGTRLRLAGTLGYRFQPYLATIFSVDYNNIILPKPWGNTKLWLVGPRVDVTFRNNLFWTTFVQYNSQATNLNINTRLQWRYKPASDFYLVYTDNYLPENMNLKNRALVLKLTYWWNV